MIEEFFKKNRELISRQLEIFLSIKGKELGGVPWGKEVSARLLSFSLGGKMIRGGLVLLAYDVFGGKNKQEAIRAACAVELLESSLLIHDDIIDKDYLRRGERSIFADYGENLGICFGDIGFFLAYEILPHGLREIFSKKSIEVGLGQMQDIYLSFSKKSIDEKDILEVYLYKTASYSCSLPLMMGAALAGRDQKTVLKMEELGKYLGVIFQIKDDELGLFGEEKEIGKAVGGDIREGKKTLYYLYLFERASGADLKRLKDVFGNKKIAKADILYVREMVKKLGVDKEINKKLGFYEKKAERLIGNEKLFKELLGLSLKRKR
jgi:geranylgeranyl diphosphate synthase, type I